MKKIFLLFLLISLIVFPIIGHFVDRSSVAFVEIERVEDDCSKQKSFYTAKTLFSLRGQLPKEMRLLSHDLPTNCPPSDGQLTQDGQPRIIVNKPCSVIFQSLGGDFFENSLLFNKLGFNLEVGQSYLLKFTATQDPNSISIARGSCGYSGYLGKRITSFFDAPSTILVYYFGLLVSGYFIFVYAEMSFLPLVIEWLSLDLSASVVLFQILIAFIFLFPFLAVLFCSWVVSRLFQQVKKKPKQ